MYNLSYFSYYHLNYATVIYNLFHIDGILADRQIDIDVLVSYYKINKHNHSQIDRYIERKIDIQNDWIASRMNKQMDVYCVDRQNNKQIDYSMEKWIDRRIGTQIVRSICIMYGIYIDKQKDIYIFVDDINGTHIQHK